MKKVVFLLLIFFGGVSGVWAQQPQIPTLQVCNPTKVYGKGYLKIESRRNAQRTGSCLVYIPKQDPVTCDPRSGYPRGKVFIAKIDMTDSLRGDIESTYIEQVTTTGKHTPTVYIKGRCKVSGPRSIPGCRFWLMIADNRNGRGKKPSDVVSFLVFDAAGRRIAYGTAPLLEGDFIVSPTSY